MHMHWILFRSQFSSIFIFVTCTQAESEAPAVTGEEGGDISISKSTEEVGGSVAEWLACWTQAQKARVQIAVATLLGNSLRQSAHTHCVSVHQAAKLVAALLRVAGVTADLAESNGSLPLGL